MLLHASCSSPDDRVSGDYGENIDDYHYDHYLNDYQTGSGVKELGGGTM